MAPRIDRYKITARRSATWLLLAASFTAVRAQARGQEQGASALTLVLAYEKGDFNLSATTQTLKWREFGLAFSKNVQSWIDGGGSVAEKQRRSQVAASAALEIASTGRRDHWRDASILVEAGCALIRRAEFTPDATERAWHAAAVALIEGAGDDTFLVAQEQPGSFLERTRHGAFDHLNHVLRRFPDDDMVPFVRALVAERTTFPEPPRTESWVSDLTKLRSAKEAVDFARASGHSLPDPAAMQLAREYDRRARMGTAIDMFLALRSRSSFEAEAILRAGKLLSRQRRFSEALSLISEVPSKTKDPFLIHLAQLFAGEIMEATGRPQLAAQAYRDALVIRPRAQTASLRLSALLVSGGQSSEATNVISEATAQEDQAQDPWKSYGYGTYRRWPELIADLRMRLGRRTQ